jgi:hypothetical protein
MEQQIRQWGYPLPPRDVTTPDELQEYVSSLRLDELSFRSLQNIARNFQISPRGPRDVLLSRLQDQEVRIPPLIRDDLSPRDCEYWSSEYREAVARHYGVTITSSGPVLCQNIKSRFADLNSEPITFEVRTVRTRPEQILVFPLQCRNLVPAELRAIAQEQQITITDHTSVRICELLNRIIPVGSQVALRHFPLIYTPYGTRRVITREGCTNIDVARVRFRYIEDDRTYCFSKTDLDLLRQFKINLYTGRVLTPSALYELGVEEPGPDLDSLCSEDDTLEVPVSERTQHWLQEWMGEGVSGNYDYSYRIDPQVRIELAQFKHCTPVKAYRGLNFNIGEYLAYKQQNPGKQYHSRVLTSWTTNKGKARQYASSSTYGIVLRMNIHPRDIFVDTTLLPESFYDQKHLRSQDEIIVLPGTYEVVEKDA